jgi:membrane protease YdiL (CAAX protease family)
MQAVMRSPAFLTGLVVWLAAVATMAVADRSAAFIALGAAVYAAVLLGATVWLIPVRSAARDDDVLRSARTRRFGVRLIVVATSAAIVFAFYTGYGLVAAGTHLPVMLNIMRFFSDLYRAHHFEAYTAFNFVALALIPGVLLLALGAKPRELGLTPPARYTYRAMTASLLLPAVFVVVAFARGKLSPVGLLGLLVHNLFSNGFSEEFFARGMILSHLRALVRSDWALFGQAMIFALMHFGGTIGEEHGNVPLIVANVVAENFPIAIMLGVMALRARSLVLPTVVHISLDTMKDLVM